MDEGWVVETEGVSGSKGRGVSREAGLPCRFTALCARVALSAVSSTESSSIESIGFAVWPVHAERATRVDAFVR